MSRRRYRGSIIRFGRQIFGGPDPFSHVPRPYGCNTIWRSFYFPERVMRRTMHVDVLSLRRPGEMLEMWMAGGPLRHAAMLARARVAMVEAGHRSLPLPG